MCDNVKLCERKQTLNYVKIDTAHVILGKYVY